MKVENVCYEDLCKLYMDYRSEADKSKKENVRLQHKIAVMEDAKALQEENDMLWDTINDIHRALGDVTDEEGPYG